MSGDTTLPNFIRAKSAKRLRTLMLKNNARLKMAYVVYDKYFDGVYHYAWYEEPIWEIKDLKDN